MDDTYAIRVSGKTPEEVNRSLGSKRGNLTKKFAAAEVSTEVEVISTLYEGSYDLKGECQADACVRHSEIVSMEGWEALNRKAQSTLGSVKNYDASYGITQLLDLTPKQDEALEPKRTPAGGLELTSGLSGVGDIALRL